MSLTVKTKLAGVLFLSWGAGIVSSHPAPKADVAVAISVFNDAGVGEAVLGQAEARAERIMAQAGVRVTWLNCGGQKNDAEWNNQPHSVDCTAIRFPEHLSVRIVRHPLAASEDTFGQSFSDASGQGCYADIYHARFESLGSERPLSDAEILGHVIAHEAGHLLLGRNSHSALGLMQAHWDRSALNQASKGSLLFTTAQAAMMRQRLNAAGVVVGKTPINIPGGRGK